ncbi:hypothetical protein DL769_010915 [Monosporascus sp. CRB-8-3]|nr:hypothetical protein DL769_010915 [Monosporascus sp. CRB-8-3]
MAARDNDTEPDYCRGIYAAGPGRKDIYVQSVISLGLGFTALFAFCILRPRWKTLYAARKRRSDPQIALPVLPDSFLGWIPALYRVTEEQVLASAGLDAFVFLNFFKMSLRLFSAMLFFALAVLWPIHKMFDTVGSGDDDNDISNVEWNFQTYPVQRPATFTIKDDKDRTYLWAYLVFTWFFSLLTIYYMDTETTKVVKIRQDYLGTQSTVTDRTFRLVGIPKDLRSEEKIKQFVENLEIGNVKSVTLCRDWAKLDALMAERETILRKLEEAWTAFLAQKPKNGIGRSAPANPNGDRPTNDDEESQESSRLLASNSLQDRIAERKRPEIRIRFGFLKIRSRSVDALDYYEEKLRRLDERIQEARRKEYRPTATAKIAPSFGKSLESHEITGALVRTGLPTLIVSLLNVLVPYLYDFLSNRQGMVSQGDVELSVISKNFFFVFFNIFLVYAVSGSAALSRFWRIIGDSLRDTQKIALQLAKGISGLNNFYLNFIMLQGLGLFPFKLLQFGDLALYPIYRMGAKTPRDFAQLMKPTLFNYGFYLPTALLVFILCLVYSILPGAHLVLLLGLFYFGLGYLVYKYQLLYSMDQPQHATGKAWQMICERIVLGLLVFQVVMISILVLRLAFFQAALVGPLLLSTFWYLFYHRRRFTPLTKFIALRSIKRHSDPGTESRPDQDPAARRSETRLARRLSTIDEDKEKGMRFVNPSLVAPLEQPWIYTDPPSPLIRDESAITISSDSIDNGNSNDDGSGSRPRGLVSGMLSGSSSFSLGDTHIWRENGNGNGGATDM